MKSYIGAPISRVMLDYGPPDNVYDLGPGARAYQWRKQKRQVVPGQSSGEIRDTRRGKRYERERREDGSGVSKPSSAALRRARLA
ncbi:hypothetical protein [Rhizobium sp.]|uniref:hypothetical protein n=1 Tax=Rhizobium sp. TaxID=391 RepID=UPI003F7F3038